jgi:hypothetical protein
MSWLLEGRGGRVRLNSVSLPIDGCSAGYWCELPYRQSQKAANFGGFGIELFDQTADVITASGQAGFKIIDPQR